MYVVWNYDLLAKWEKEKTKRSERKIVYFMKNNQNHNNKNNRYESIIFRWITCCVQDDVISSSGTRVQF